MKHNKTFFLLMILFLLIGSIQVDSISAQESDQPEPDSSQARSMDGAPSFGMNFHRNAFTVDTIGKADAANNHWVRYNGLLWSGVQPLKEGGLNWEYSGNPNQYLIDAHDAGMEVILIIRSTPTWAQLIEGASCGPMKPQYIDAFADFMKAVVEEYSGHPYYVKYYEIWNEPDAPLELVLGPDTVYGCWGNPADPYFGGGYYGEVLREVYPKVKIANSEAQIVLGGLLLPADPEGSLKDWVHPKTTWPYSKQSKFFEGILAAGFGEYFDVVNFHGFSFYRDGFPSGIRMEKAEPLINGFWIARGGQVEGKLAFLREIMARFKIADKPIILSETGLPLTGSDNAAWPTWSTDKQKRYQTLKADYVTYLYTRNIAVGIDVTTWYHYRGGWYQSGLLTSEGNELDAYYAYKGVTTALEGATFKQRLNTCGGLLGFEFQRPGGYLWVLFSEDGTNKTIQLTQGNTVYNNRYIDQNLPPGTYKFIRPTFIEFTGSAPILPYCTFLPLLRR